MRSRRLHRGGDRVYAGAAATIPSGSPSPTWREPSTSNGTPSRLRSRTEWPEESIEWSLFQLSAEQSDEYPERSDLITGLTLDPALSNATLTGRFHSSRFSRSGERFCYVKIDGVGGLTGSEFDDRGAIEEALDELLRAEGAGCVIGAGTGLRYSYIDLALTDLDNGLAVARARLARGGLPRRSWIQFLDMGWTREWIGIHPDTAPPPMP